MGILYTVDLEGLTNLLTFGDCSINDDWMKNATESYLVAATMDVRPNYIRDNCVALFTPHPTDFAQYVTNVSVRPFKDEPSRYLDPTGAASDALNTQCFWWQVDLTFGAYNPMQKTITGNPKDMSVDRRFQVQPIPIPIDFAYNVNTQAMEAVLNSAGFPYDPGVEGEVYKLIMTFMWNELDYSPFDLGQYGSYINNDLWNGFPPYSVKFSPPNMEDFPFSQFLNQNYYRLAGEFIHVPFVTGWNAIPIDRGFIALDDDGNPYKILDEKGMDIPTPMLLNGSGQIQPDPTQFVQQNYQIYKDISFTNTFPQLNNLFV